MCIEEKGKREGGRCRRRKEEDFFSLYSEKCTGHTHTFIYTYTHTTKKHTTQVLDYYKLPLSAVLVIVDEVALELGQIRLRQTGSAGGHNGLKSIESYVKSKDYNRLRVGVGGGKYTHIYTYAQRRKGRDETRGG
jgi:peptidyl-tRNA hydrolase